jgi:KUP system potassium uptake protein
MMHHVRRIKVLHEKIVLLTIEFEHSPTIDESDRAKCESLGKGFYKVVAHFGFMERPDVPALLADLKASGALPVEIEDATYYVGRETFIASPAGEMGAVTESIFAFLARNAKDATSYFAIPHKQVVELGTQIDL